jgi:hypothetical protein
MIVAGPRNRGPWQGKKISAADLGRRLVIEQPVSAAGPEQHSSSRHVVETIIATDQPLSAYDGIRVGESVLRDLVPDGKAFGCGSFRVRVQGSGEDPILTAWLSFRMSFVQLSVVCGPVFPGSTLVPPSRVVPPSPVPGRAGGG